MNVSVVAHCSGYRFCHFQDGHIFPTAHIDMAEHGLGMLAVGGFVEVHNVHTGRCHVVHVQEFAHGCACAPDGNGRCLVDLGFMEATNQCRDDVGVFGVVVVTRPIEVGRHDAAVVHPVAGAVLSVVAFAELDASDLGDGVGLVGGF